MTTKPFVAREIKIKNALRQNSSKEQELFYALLVIDDWIIAVLLYSTLALNFFCFLLFPNGVENKDSDTRGISSLQKEACKDFAYSQMIISSKYV